MFVIWKEQFQLLQGVKICRCICLLADLAAWAFPQCVHPLIRDSLSPSLKTELKWEIMHCCELVSRLHISSQSRAFSFKSAAFALIAPRKHLLWMEEKEKNATVTPALQELHYKQRLIFSWRSLELAVQFFMTGESLSSRKRSPSVVVFCLSKAAMISERSLNAVSFVLGQGDARCSGNQPGCWNAGGRRCFMANGTDAPSSLICFRLFLCGGEGRAYCMNKLKFRSHVKCLYLWLISENVLKVTAEK